MASASKNGKSPNKRQLRIKAIELGVAPGKRKKTELVRVVQRAEGYAPCYRTGRWDCNENCCFKEDCLQP